ncbi:MAG: hypothetical protein IJI57_10685 [Flexilinea sp.]|nr:hypothetical protein [Flexilinea sp.]
MSGEQTNYHTKLPDAIFLELDKGATEPFSGRLKSKTEENINVGPADFPILRNMIIDYESISDWLPERKLNYFDLLVHDAVWTLYVNGVTVFSVSTVVKVMSGNSSLNPSKNQQEKVRNSISRLLSTSVKISFSQEFEQYKKGDGSSEHKTYYEGQLVAGEIITDKINNRFSNAVVRILREPILGELAYMKGQVTQVSNIYLSVPIRLEIDTYKLRDYLLRRILRKDRRKNKQNERSIRLETLWTFMEIEEDEYMTRMRTLEKIEKMLSYWQKEKMIADYQVFNDKIIVRLLKK